MVSFKSATIALAALGAAMGALSKCLFLTTVTDAAGVAALNACPTLSGDITVEGDGLGGAVELGQVEELNGKLALTNSTSVTSVNLNQLEKVTSDGELSITKFTSVFNIDLSKLSEVEGNLTLVTMPSLSGMNLNKGLSTLNSLTISDTALSDLQGLLSNITEMTYLDLDNNKNMSSIDLPLETVSNNIILSFNDDNANVTLDKLESAFSLVIQDVAKVSLKKLKSVNQTFQIAYSFFEELELPSLETVDGSVRVVANEQMLNVSFPALTEIGGELGFDNNTKLQDLGETFPKLENIKGALNIKGDIGAFDLPALKQVAGTFSLESTNDELDCSKALDKSKVKANDPVCSAPEKKEALSASGSSTSTGKNSKSSSASSDSSSSDKKSSGAALLLPSVAAVAAAAGFFLL